MARDALDVTFSPDGRLLATAHSYNADPGEVMLWDMTTGARVAKLPVGDRDVASVTFSPNGRLLAGRVRAMADPRSPWEIVLWDVAMRREVRTLGGPGGGISGLDFAPDGMVLASCGADGVVRFRDVTSGREVRRIDGAGSARALAFAPDGRTLILSGGLRPITLWDLAVNRRRDAPEPDGERFAVYAIAVAPDGRTLAAAGATHDAKGVMQQGQVRLYDLTGEPPARRAVLTFDGPARGLAGPNDRTTMCSDVAFAPDGGRVVAVAMEKVRAWDAATGAERDAFERDTASSSDRLAVSPDGRWMAITSPFGAGVSIPDTPRRGRRGRPGGTIRAIGSPRMASPPCEALTREGWGGGSFRNSSQRPGVADRLPMTVVVEAVEHLAPPRPTTSGCGRPTTAGRRPSRNPRRGDADPVSRGRRRRAGRPDRPPGHGCP